MCSCGENTGGSRGGGGCGGVGEGGAIGKGGRRVGGASGGGWGVAGLLLCAERGVNNKWPGPHLIGSDFNPMFHHKLVERGECLGFGLSITDMCRQADTIISLIVTSPAQ